MRILRSPVVQFLVVALLVLAGITVASSWLAQRAAEEEALAEARRSNEVITRGVIQRSVTPEVVRGRSGALDGFTRQMRNRLLVGQLRRINIWTEQGELLFSSEYDLIGDSFPLGDERRQVLRSGGTGSTPSDADDPENAAGASTEGQVQIFTGFRARTGDRLLFEGYYQFSDIEERQDEIFGSFRWITIGGLVIFVLVVTPLLVVLTRRLTSGAKERERLLHAALDASDAERRRIARDLHDGVVQDLAGTGFSISAVARDPQTPEAARSHLHDASASLRTSLTSLRSLLAEIHPPDLQAEGLPAALNDLIAPAAAAGLHASVSVEGAESVSHDQAALVWRVAQEAVRNAMRHADASTLAVTVVGSTRGITLEVVDDGRGFDPAAGTDPTSFGLKGLRSLVRDAGGSLEVTSSMGEGTTVRMEVEAR